MHRISLFALLLLVTALVQPNSVRADVVRIEQNHPSIRYDAEFPDAWQTVSGSAVSGGSVLASNRVGSTVTVTFHGTGISWIGYRCACAAGLAMVYVDGGQGSWAYNYAENPEAQTEIYSVQGLPEGEHVLTIEISGSRDQAGDSAHVVIDAFDIDTGKTWQFVEQDDLQVAYTGAWTTISDTSVSAGRIVAARDAGARATTTFTGTGIAWIGYRCPCAAGIARVYLDGTLVTTVNTYSAAREAQVEIWRAEGLAYGEHTLVVDVSGDSVADNPWIAVDAFRVLNAGDAGDTTPPTIVIEEPLAGATAPRLLQIQVQAQDETSEPTVTFYLDGEVIRSTGSGADSRFYASVYTYALPNGSHTLTAVARDAAGNPALASIDINVNNEEDTEFPTVRFTSPANEALVTGAVTLTVDAFDAMGVTNVRFYADGVLLGEDNTPPYSITRDTSNIQSGSRYLLTAIAEDAAGNDGASVIFATVQHEDRTRPVAAITEPAPGATVSGTITLTANATDANGITQVEFWRTFQWGTITFGLDESAPYTVTLDTTTLPDGMHTFHARATDAAGNTNLAGGAATLTVDNSVVPGRIRVDDADPAIVYTGEWQQYSDASAGPYYHWGLASGSETIGDRVSFTFTGIGVRWIGPRCYQCGFAQVSIDGGTPVEVGTVGGQDLGRPGQIVDTIYESPALPYGTHTIEITLGPPRNQGNLVIVDAFEILVP